MESLIEKYRDKIGTYYEKFLKDSTCGTFYFDKDNKAEYKKWDAKLLHRNQQGWENIWQKVFTTDDEGMSLGITVVEPGGGGRDGIVELEFCDFVLCGNGTLEVNGIGSFEIKAGDFLHFKEGIKRSFRNTGNDLFVAIFCLKSKSSFNFKRD